MTFLFQVTLLDNGDIVFSYKSVPLVITLIEDADHPVKVGLSDAYIIDRTIFCESNYYSLRVTVNQVNLQNAIFGSETQSELKGKVNKREKAYRDCQQ